MTPFWQSFIQLSIFWLPFVVVYLLGWLYLYYIRAKYIKNLEWVTLEIKIPKEIGKTPQAMEVVLNALDQSRDSSNFLIGSLIKGEIRPWFSLELVSVGGEIHFYIQTQKFFKNLVESQIYAQYPSVEVFEVPDYTAAVPYGLPDSDWQLWGAEFKLTKEDAYPIKTYIGYGLDKLPDEEHKVTDPITSTLEFMGSIGPGEQIWLQILVMATKKRFHKPGTWFGKRSWKEEGEELIKKLMKRDKLEKLGPDEHLNIGELMLSPGERQVVEEVERSISKPGFDCGMRGIYLAKPDKFNFINVVGLTGSAKQYSSHDLNGFKPAKTTTIKYPWQDPTGRRLIKAKAVMFDAYRRRSYFYPPYLRRPFVLNTEELATIFHFPGQAAMTPTLAKIESKRAEPPVNLPV